MPRTLMPLFGVYLECGCTGSLPSFNKSILGHGSASYLDTLTTYVCQCIAIAAAFSHLSCASLLAHYKADLQNFKIRIVQTLPKIHITNGEICAAAKVARYRR